MRLGAERICLAFPPGGERNQFYALRGHPPYLGAEDGDDAVDGMGLYEKGGAVATWCGQLALYDLQGDADLTVTCLGCIANERKL